MKRFSFAMALVSILYTSAFCPLFAQNDATPKPILRRVEATDPASGNHYVRLMISLPAQAGADPAAPPHFTVQCEDIKGKHQMLWFLSFGGVADPGYEPPFHSSAAHLYPPSYPAVNLKMTFEGYIKSKPFTRSWSILPSGELRYRNSGSDSPNMETAQWFLRFLSPLPGLRVVHAKPEKGDLGDLFFPVQPLLEEINKTPICTP